MCRMLAVRSSDPRVRREVLLDFQTQAARSFNGPEDHRSHADGWGVAALAGPTMFHFGRSPLNAMEDPEYAKAAARVEVVTPDSFVLAHVRDASEGAVHLKNSHPFIRMGWAFAHNGSIHDLEAPPALIAEGTTDSERFFLHILAEYQKHHDMGLAIRQVVPVVAAKYNHTSLTFILTDGRTLYAFRRAGPDPGECETRDCQLEYYALGMGTYKGAQLLTQEPQLFPGLEHWKELADGELLIIPRVGAMRTVPIFTGPAPPVRRRMRAATNGKNGHAPTPKVKIRIRLPAPRQQGAAAMFGPKPVVVRKKRAKASKKR